MHRSKIIYSGYNTVGHKSLHAPFKYKILRRKRRLYGNFTDALRHALADIGDLSAFIFIKIKEVKKCKTRCYKYLNTPVMST